MSGRFSSTARPELYAQELRHELHLNNYPVDVGAICDALGVVYRETDLGRSGGYDGALVRQGASAGILVNQNISYAGRKRFTGAHEVGHFRIKHHDQPEYWCTARDIEDYRSSSPVEAEANRFAAELLLPSDRISAVLKRHGPTLDLVRELADDYGTSLTAAALRVVKLAPEPAALIISEAGCIKWSVPSDKMQARNEIRHGKLSENSYAYDAFQGKPLPDHAVRVRGDAWLTGLAPSTELLEHSVAFTGLGLVLTLLTALESDEDDSEDDEY